MRRSIETRLTELENAQGPRDRIDTIINIIVSPGRLDAEICVVTGEDGQRWERRSDETGKDLEARAVLEVRRKPGGVARLLAWPGEHEEMTDV